MTYDDVRRLALTLPGVTESTSYGTPALKAKGKLLARLLPDGDSLVVLGVEADERAMLVEAFPQTYSFTDHYRDYPIVLVRLSQAEPTALHRMIEQRWLAVAPKRLRAERGA